MSKKTFIVIVSIVLVLFSVSMLIACVGVKPVVTLDYRYPAFDWNFDGRSVTEPIYIKDTVKSVRFSHYQAPTPFRQGYSFVGWYKDIGYTVAWINGEDTVSRDITLYAKWVKTT